MNGNSTTNVIFAYDYMLIQIPAKIYIVFSYYLIPIFIIFFIEYQS